MLDEAKFFAWLDGELDAHEAEEVAGHVAGDPGLTALARKHRQLKERLRAAFEPVAVTPLGVASQRIADCAD